MRSSRAAGRLRLWRLEHLHPGGSALCVGQHGGASSTANHVEVKGGLVGGGESAVECVGQHGLALCAVLRVAGATGTAGLFATELAEVWHLDHLPFYTVQKPCKFPPTAADAAFYRSFGNAENLGYLFVIHIL